MREFKSSDGTVWTVEVKVPSFSSAMVRFRHRDEGAARRDRYTWYNASHPAAHDPRSRLTAGEVLQALTDHDVALLFRRSMPVHTERPRYVVS